MAVTHDEAIKAKVTSAHWSSHLLACRVDLISAGVIARDDHLVGGVGHNGLGGWADGVGVFVGSSYADSLIRVGWVASVDTTRFL